MNYLKVLYCMQKRYKIIIYVLLNITFSSIVAFNFLNWLMDKENIDRLLRGAIPENVLFYNDINHITTSLLEGKTVLVNHPYPFIYESTADVRQDYVQTFHSSRDNFNCWGGIIHLPPNSTCGFFGNKGGVKIQWGERLFFYSDFITVMQKVYYNAFEFPVTQLFFPIFMFYGLAASFFFVKRKSVNFAGVLLFSVISLFWLGTFIYLWNCIIFKPFSHQEQKIEMLAQEMNTKDLHDCKLKNIVCINNKLFFYDKKLGRINNFSFVIQLPNSQSNDIYKFNPLVSYKKIYDNIWVVEYRQLTEIFQRSNSFIFLLFVATIIEFLFVLFALLRCKYSTKGI